VRSPSSRLKASTPWSSRSRLRPGRPGSRVRPAGQSPATQRRARHRGHPKRRASWLRTWAGPYVISPVRRACQLAPGASGWGCGQLLDPLVLGQDIRRRAALGAEDSADADTDGAARPAVLTERKSLAAPSVALAMDPAPRGPFAPAGRLLAEASARGAAAGGGAAPGSAQRARPAPVRASDGGVGGNLTEGKCPRGCRPGQDRGSHRVPAGDPPGDPLGSLPESIVEPGAKMSGGHRSLTAFSQ
jgi:hypothetical protein